MSNLSVTDFTVNDGPRTVPNPLGLPVDQAIRNEIMTHHFFGRNRDNTVKVMDKIYGKLLNVLERFNDGTLLEENARFRIAKLDLGE